MARRYVCAYEFIAENDDELDLDEGSVVELVSKVDEEWVKVKSVELNAAGLVPLAYLVEQEETGAAGGKEEAEEPAVFDLRAETAKSSNDLKTDPPVDIRNGSSDAGPPRAVSLSTRQMVCHHEFVAEEDDELDLHVGDVIELLDDSENVGEEWLKGRLVKNNCEGIFPKTFVTEQENAPMADGGGMERSGARTATPTKTVKFAHPPRRQFTVAYEFVGENNDELTAKVGDVVAFVADVDDDWVEVEHVSSGRVGMVPIAFLREENKGDAITSPGKNSVSSTSPEKDAVSNTAPSEFPKEMTVQEASQSMEYAIAKVRTLEQTSEYSHESILAAREGISRSETKTERQAMLEALLDGFEASEIRQLAIQTKQMLMMVDNAIKNKDGNESSEQMIASFATTLSQNETKDSGARRSSVEKQRQPETAKKKMKRSATKSRLDWKREGQQVMAHERARAALKQTDAPRWSSPSPSSISPSSTPSYTPTPSHTPKPSLTERKVKKRARRHASIAFVSLEPATKSFISSYRPQIVSQYVASLTGCLYISVEQALRKVLKRKGQVSRDITSCLIKQVPVPRGIVLSVLFGAMKDAVDDFDKHPNKYQTEKNFYGSPGRLKYYDFIIEGYPCDEKDVYQFESLATSLFPEGLDWRIVYLQCPDPKEVEKQRLRKHTWNAKSTGKIEEAKVVRGAQVAFRKRILSLMKAIAGTKPKNLKHVAKGSKIGGKAKQRLYKVDLAKFDVRGVVREVAVCIAGSTSTLDRKLENTPDAFVGARNHERGVQTSMSELPPSAMDKSKRRKKRFRKNLMKRRAAAPFVRGGSPIHTKATTKFVPIDGKIRQQKYPFKRATSVAYNAISPAKEVDFQDNDRDRIRTAPTMSIKEELWRWLRALSLSSWNRVENPDNWRRALANGYVFAEILCEYFPRALSIHMFDPMAGSTRSKRDNWKLLINFFKRHRVDLGAPDRLLLGNFSGVRPKKGFQSTLYMCNAAMNASAGSALSVLKGIYFFLLRLGLVSPLQNLYIPKFVKAPTPVTPKRQDVSAEQTAAQMLISAMEQVKMALQKNAHGKTHVDLRGFQGRKLMPKEFRKQLKIQLGLKLSDPEYELVYAYFDRDGDGSIDYVEVMHKFLHVSRMVVPLNEAMSIAQKVVARNQSNPYGSLEYSNLSLPPAVATGTPSKSRMGAMSAGHNVYTPSYSQSSAQFSVTPLKPPANWKSQRRSKPSKRKDGQRVAHFYPNRHPQHNAFTQRPQGHLPTPPAALYQGQASLQFVPPPPQGVPPPQHNQEHSFLAQSHSPYPDSNSRNPYLQYQQPRHQQHSHEQQQQQQQHYGNNSGFQEAFF